MYLQEFVEFAKVFRLVSEGSSQALQLDALMTFEQDVAEVVEGIYTE